MQLLIPSKVIKDFFILYFLLFIKRFLGILMSAKESSVLRNSGCFVFLTEQGGAFHRNAGGATAEAG
jgi:hypothetical protein